MFNSKKFVSILEHSELQSAIQKTKRIRWLFNLILEMIAVSKLSIKYIFKHTKINLR